MKLTDIIISPVKKIKCTKESDGGYKCDITSGKYVNWFANCVGDRLRGKMHGRINPLQRMGMFRLAAMDCRGRYYRGENIISDLDERKTDTYFVKNIELFNGFNNIKIDKDSISAKTKNGRCVFDENNDSLICERG